MKAVFFLKFNIKKKEEDQKNKKVFNLISKFSAIAKKFNFFHVESVSFKSKFQKKKKNSRETKERKIRIQQRPDRQRKLKPKLFNCLTFKTWKMNFCKNGPRCKILELPDLHGCAKKLFLIACGKVLFSGSYKQADRNTIFGLSTGISISFKG